MLLKIKDKKTDVIYTSDMSDQNIHAILSLNFCTSYTEVEVQDKIEEDGKITYPKHTVILPPIGTKPYWVDLIATQEDNDGEWVD
jgi:hypothetical protein